MTAKPPLTCTKSIVYLFRIYPALLYTISCALFAFLLTVHFKIRRTFHPFFSLLFGLVILVYIICGLVAIGALVFSLYDDVPFIAILTVTEDVTYTIITPLVLCVVLERVYATRWYCSYERSRPWIALVIGQILVVVFTIACKCVDIENYVWVTEDQILFATSVLNLVVALVLLIINRYQAIRTNKHSMTLTEKYQITENIRVVRIILPVVMLDNLITITDTVAYFVFDIDYVFDPEQCWRADYIPLFVVLTSLSAVLELAIPFAVLLRHQAYRKRASRMLCRPSHTGSAAGRQTVCCVSCMSAENKARIRNVLGKEVHIRQSQSVAFAAMLNHWESAIPPVIVQ